MKSLMLLWQELLIELGSWRHICTTQDRKYALRRFENEKLSFLTITLPDFCKDFEQALDQKQADRNLWTGFQAKGELPRFLGGFLDLIFDRESGVLLDNPDKDMIFAIRQLTLAFGKIHLPCTPAREKAAFDGYIKCEQDIQVVESEWSSDDLADFSRVSRLLFSELFSKVDEDIYYGRITPKHGPGMTADRVSNNSRFLLKTWTSRLEEIFSCSEFVIPSFSYHSLLRDVDVLEPGREIPVKVISVPKTLKTPRIIAMEPAHMMYVQQAILECFLDHWRRDDILHQLIGFDDQTPNQRLALEGSQKGTLATLDLSEASDRVSNKLVHVMLERFPWFNRGVDASRSRRANVLGHGIINLSKFASMGSALCFPVEACVFLTCIFLGIEKELNTPLTRGIIKRYQGSVRVFGDDIIIPKEFVATVVSSLEHFGAKVNYKKSFWNGKFRESCGKEYYDGTDVSIVRIRTVLPTQRQHASEVLSMSSTRNQLYQLGLWRTCAWMDEYLTKILGRYPVVLPTSPVIGRDSIFGYDVQKWDHQLDRPLVKGYLAVSRSPIDPIDGEAALLKYFLKRGFTPYEEGHLERAGRPDAVYLKLRWGSAV